jgi:hypothetical protein
MNMIDEVYYSKILQRVMTKTFYFFQMKKKMKFDFVFVINKTIETLSL